MIQFLLIWVKSILHYIDNFTSFKCYLNAALNHKKKKSQITNASSNLKLTNLSQNNDRDDLIFLFID